MRKFLGEKYPTHNTCISDEKTQREKGAQHTGCWQNILPGCSFDQVTISAGIECVLLFKNYLLISFIHSPLWPLM